MDELPSFKCDVFIRFHPSSLVCNSAYKRRPNAMSAKYVLRFHRRCITLERRLGEKGRPLKALGKENTELKRRRMWACNKHCGTGLCWLKLLPSSDEETLDVWKACNFE